MRIFNLCGVTAALLLLSGCATMFTGMKQDIEVRTQNDDFFLNKSILSVI